MEHTPNFEEIDVQKHFQVLQRRWLPAVSVFGTVATLASLFALSLKPAYKAEGSLLIKTNHSPSLTGLGEGLGRIDSLTINNNPSDTQAKIVTSVPVIKETITELDLKDDKGKPLKIQDLTKQLKVEGAKGTEVLQVTYADNNPNMAAAVVNTVMRAYIRNNIGANREEAVSAREFILGQIPRTEIAVRQAEIALRKFKEENQIISLQEEATAAVTDISKLNERISQAQAQLGDVNARLKKIQNQAKIDSQQTLTATSLSQIPGVQQALVQLQEAQSQLTVARTTLLPGHPTIINLEEKVAALNNLLQQRTKQAVGSDRQISQSDLQTGALREKLLEDYARFEAERVGLAKQITTLADKRTVYTERANVLPKLEQNQRQLERKLKAAQTTYETLLTRLQEIQVAENQNVGNARIVSPAVVPDQPTGVGKSIVIGGGVVLGLMLGIITAFSLDLIDRSVKTVKEAKELFKYNLLGVIPSVSSKGKKSSDKLERLERSLPRIIGRDVPHYPLGEAYQMLQANLKFLTSEEREIKAISVTSAVSKEGKSEVAANLAVAMAQVGRRVLLVDADMRNPVQHHVWGMANTLGLSNIIVNQLPIHEIVQEVIPNLHFLPSGVIPSNPVALLDSKRMALLVASLTQRYDCVIFDTPSLSGTADAAILSKLADGLLLVVRPGVINSVSASVAKEFLTQSGQNVLGMVLNGVNVKHEPESDFYYTKAQVEPEFMLPTSIPKTLAAPHIKEER
ncbi:MAG: polysaccharide biosynthesis tyrosine autokinase [Rhizonema sp. NSF051]|nr:polysaccharide biosynthesis tyrosine autokinase [Rhizonema sp. NSF051]